MRNRAAEQIRELVDTKEAMEYYGVEFNRAGFAHCPFHADSTPSLSVKKGRFKCFGCGISGGVIDFVMEYFGLNFGQAIIKLNADFNLMLAAERPSYRDRIAEQKRQQRRKLEKAKLQGLRTQYLSACKHHKILYHVLLCGPKIDGLAEYVDRLECWLDEHIGEVRD